MIVRTLSDVEGSAADVKTADWRSLRYLRRADRVPFTITDTTLEAGTDVTLWYKHHLEACLCLEGDARLEDLLTGETFDIGPGTMYALDQNDRHRLVARARTRLICVFSPALQGNEQHDEAGSYPPPQEA